MLSELYSWVGKWLILEIDIQKNAVDKLINNWYILIAVTPFAYLHTVVKYMIYKNETHNLQGTTDRIIVYSTCDVDGCDRNLANYDKALYYTNIGPFFMPVSRGLTAPAAHDRSRECSDKQTKCDNILLIRPAFSWLKTGHALELCKHSSYVVVQYTGGCGDTSKNVSDKGDKAPTPVHHDDKICL